MVIEILSLVTAMMCLLQFYHQTKEQIKQHNALLKFAAIKIVVFIFYVQSVRYQPRSAFAQSFNPNTQLTSP